MPSILQQIAVGEHSAVQRCVDEYGGLVWRLATRYLGDSRSETEDAVQEVFVALWLHAARFDPSRGSEAAFVATIAHRRLTDMQRRRVARREVTGAQIAEPPGALAAHDAQARDDDTLVAVSEAFDRLPRDERHVLWMAVWGGLTHRQIAEATGAAIGTVKTRLRRGVRRMYESLHALEGVDVEREDHP